MLYIDYGYNLMQAQDIINENFKLKEPKHEFNKLYLCMNNYQQDPNSSIYSS